MRWEKTQSALPLLHEETLGVTAPHPFYVISRSTPGFVPAGELRAGDVLQLANGGTAAVISNPRQSAPDRPEFATYNFEVADFHTYFVGEAGVWVHNMGAVWCQEVFGIFDQYFKKTKDLWKAFDEMLAGAHATLLDKELLTRWRLRLYNEVRAKYFSGLGGATKPHWNDAAKIAQQLEVGVLNAALDEAVLGKNLEILTGVPNPGNEFGNHHLLMGPQGETRPNMKRLQERGKAILDKHNIGINDGANGVRLPNANSIPADFDQAVYGPLHGPRIPGQPNIHTLTYLETVTTRLDAADAAIGTPEAVRNELQKIAHELVSGVTLW